MKNKILYLLTVCMCGCLLMFGQTDTITMKFQEYTENPEIAGTLIKTHFYLDHTNADKEIERHLKDL